MRCFLGSLASALGTGDQLFVRPYLPPSLCLRVPWAAGGGGDSQAVLSPSQAHEHHLNTQLWQARGRPTHGLHLQVVSSVSENAIDTWEVSVQGPGIPACPIQSCETQEALFPLSVFSTTNPGSELS